ncbi:MAG: dockerin type I repeat-containing protein [Bacteroidaceae bacterium]|nr:dockerin type I repeat-containing protein [Bacteroidaceae bacterium]
MKRFTLKQTVLSLATTAMLLFSQGICAANHIRLTPVDGYIYYSNESYENLVDENINSKWGTWFQPDENANTYSKERIAYIIVKAYEPILPSQYYLVTADNTENHPTDIWSSWKIYGGNFASDADAKREGEGWTLIDTKEQEFLPTGNSVGVTLNFDYKGTEKFQYYWIEITAAVDYTRDDHDSYMTMAEFGLGTYKAFQDYLVEKPNIVTDPSEAVIFSWLSSSKGHSGESADMLFDNNPSSKWCYGVGDGAYVIFKASRAMALTYYKMITGGDSGTYSDRNWKTWQVYGMNAESKDDVTRESEAWVLLDDKTNVPAGVGMNQLAAADKATSYFTPSENVETEFVYFKIELKECVGGTGTQQMSEFTLGDKYTVAIDRTPIANAFKANFDPNVFAQKTLVDQMSSTLEQLATCDDASQFVGLMENASNLEGKIKLCARSYDDLQVACNQVRLALDGTNLTETGAAYLTAWIGENVIAPNEEYPCGSFAYIKENRQLTGEEAKAEATRINIYLFNNSKQADPINVTYDFISGTEKNWNASEGPESLIDGNWRETKWGTDTGEDRFIIFKSSEPIQPTYYGLVTGGDTSVYPSRNWKNWKIWAANFESDEEATKDAEGWVLIDSKEGVGEDVLKTTSLYESFIYLSVGCTIPYQYFKIEVYHEGGMQMNEFSFYNSGNLVQYREDQVVEFEDYLEGIDEFRAYKGYREDFKTKFAEMKTTVNAPDVSKIKNELVELKEKIEKSQELYDNYDLYISDTLGVLSPESETMSAWHESYMKESIAPCPKFGRGTYPYIIDNCELDDDAIKAEMDYLKRVANAVENNLYILLGGNTVGEWGDGFYGNLIDGIDQNTTKIEDDKEVEVKATKWGGQASAEGNTYIIFRTQDPTNPFFYTLTTGNDTGSYPGRNWDTWSIYGANFEGDIQATKDAEGWVLVDERVGVKQDRLHALDAHPSYFGFSTETTVPYTYYKVVVYKASEGNAIQMNELHFGTADEFDDIKQKFTEEASEFDTNVRSEVSLIERYQAVIPEIEECANMEALARVNSKLEALRDSITACAEMYDKLEASADAVKQFLEDNPLEESEALATLNSYLTGDVDPNDVFANGSLSYILDEHVIADSIVAGEIEFLESLKVAAVSAGYVAGTDITSMIVNRSFAKAEQVLDEKGNKVSGTKKAEGWDGYIFGNDTNEEGTMSAAEFCNEQSKFNISQTMSNMKNGYYQIKLNAGFRPNGNINSFNYTAMAFANDTKTYVPVVREGMVEKEKAWTGSISDKEIYACNVDKFTGDPKVDSVVVGYVIYGIQGTINAILQDRYEINMVAKVTDGTLKFGLKNDGTLVGGDWLGAGNFRMSYLGEEATPEAIAAAAACNGERVDILTNTYVPGVYQNKDTLYTYKDSPNFGAAQKLALADAATRTTVDQLIADGNTFEGIIPVKAAYYNLAEYWVKVVDKWSNHLNSSDLLELITPFMDGLDNGQYGSVAEVDAALAALFEACPDYLDITNKDRVTNATVESTEPFDYKFETNEEGKNVQAMFGLMYDDLKANETILEFEYKSDKDIEGAMIKNGLTGEGIELETLEATSDYKKVSLNVKSLGLKKSSDYIIFRLMEKSNGATINIRKMIFVETEGIRGDLDGSGTVGVGDIEEILKYMASGEDNPAADLDGSGSVGVGDIEEILKIMAGAE